MVVLTVSESLVCCLIGFYLCVAEALLSLVTATFLLSLVPALSIAVPISWHSYQFSHLPLHVVNVVRSIIFRVLTNHILYIQLVVSDTAFVSGLVIASHFFIAIVMSFP